MLLGPIDDPELQTSVTTQGVAFDAGLMGAVRRVNWPRL